MASSQQPGPQPSAPGQPELQTSRILQDFLLACDQEVVYLRDIVQSLGDRAFGPTLLLCALPEALPIPMPPGISAVIGIPLVLLSLQLLIGLKKPWLPRWLSDRALPKSTVEAIVRRLLRSLQRVEHLVRPRWLWLSTPLMQRSLGWVLLMLAIVIALPIPFGNLPPAIAIVVISLGMIERDGVLIGLGVVGGIVVVVVMSGIILTLVQQLNLLRM